MEFFIVQHNPDLHKEPTRTSAKRSFNKPGPQAIAKALDSPHTHRYQSSSTLLLSPERALPKPAFHYGYVIVAVGVAVLFCCIGLARFGYTVLIPGMRQGLDLSYKAIGFIGAANFSGYLLAVFFAPTLIRTLRPRLTVATGLALISLSMMAISACSGGYSIAALYFLTGIGTGWANIPTMTLTTQWFARSHRGRAAGLVICGNGLGIIFVGFAVPLCGQLYGASGWRASWLLLGVVSLIVALAALLLLRNDPRALGLTPVGHDPLPSAQPPSRPTTAAEDRTYLLRLGILYLIYGATFMIYGTFIVATMIGEYHLDAVTAGVYWSWVGGFSLFSGLAFGTLSDRIGRRRGLLAVFVVQTVCYLLVAMDGGLPALVVSIALYGMAVFAAPAIVTAAIGDRYQASRVAGAFSNATFFFAFGQIIGPALEGMIGSEAEGFSLAYLVAAALTAIAACGTFLLPKTASHR